MTKDMLVYSLHLTCLGENATDRGQSREICVNLEKISNGFDPDKTQRGFRSSTNSKKLVMYAWTCFNVLDIIDSEAAVVKTMKTANKTCKINTI